MTIPVSAQVRAAPKSETIVAKNSEPEFEWRAFTTHDGLPQNSVAAVVQSKNGYLWIGTQAGLARYDGNRFKVFHVGNTPSLGGNRVLSLMESSAGELWIGTMYNGVSRLRNGKFESVSESQAGPVGEVTRILEDESGGILFVARNLTRFADGTFTQLTAPSSLPKNQPVVWSVNVDAKRRLWFITDEGEICYPYAKGNRKNFAKEAWVSVAQCASGEFADGKKWVMRDTDLFVERQPGQLGVAAISGNVPRTITHSILDRDGTCWMASPIGLIKAEVDREIQDVDAAEETRVKFTKLHPSGFSELGEVQTVFQDREGFLWAGVRRRGLIRIARKKFQSFSFPFPGHPHWASATTSIKASTAWLIFDSQIVCFRDSEFKPISFPESLESDRRKIFASATGDDNSLWVASAKNLFCYEKGTWKQFPLDVGKVSRIVAGDGEVWIGCENGLARFKNGTTRLVASRSDLNLEPGKHVMERSYDGSIWIGQLSKLTRWNQGRIEHFQTNGNQGSEIRSIYSAKDGSVWITTYGRGLLRLVNGKFRRINSQHGLIDDSLGKIIDDGNGNFWINSNRGAMRVAVEDLNQVADGISTTVPLLHIRTDEGNGLAGGISEEGKIWLPTTNGIVSIDPKTLQSRTTKTLINIEFVEANGTSFDHHKPIRVSPGSGNLEVHFNSPTFVDKEMTRFRYRLIPYDKKWIESGTRRSASYTKVPPRKYRFEVEALGPSGQWSEERAAFDVQFRPFIYQTLWFRIFCLIGLACLVVLVFRVRTLKIRQWNESLRENEERIQLALRGGELAIWDWDLKTNQINFGERITDVLGDTIADGVDGTMDGHQSRIHPDDLPLVRESLKCHLAGQTDYYDVEYRLRRADGEWVWLQDKGQIIERDSKNQPVRMCGTVRDVSEQTRLKRQVSEQHADLVHVARLNTMGEMATGLAHEINQPLAAMANYCEVGMHLLKKEPPEKSGRLGDLFSKSLEMTMRCGEIIRRLRALVAKRPSTIQRIDIQRPLKEVLLLLDSELRHLEVHIELNIDHQDYMVEVDDIQIQQVFVNLIRNSMDAMSSINSERVLTVSTKLSDKMVEVAVKDTGVGLGNHKEAELFETFFSDKPEGMGMGLPINRSIIESHGGEIWVTSNESQGLTVHFSLPAMQAVTCDSTVEQMAAGSR